MAKKVNPEQQSAALQIPGGSKEITLRYLPPKDQKAIQKYQRCRDCCPGEIQEYCDLGNVNPGTPVCRQIQNRS